MLCVAFKGGILLYEDGDRLDANHEMYLVWLRDRQKHLNGHFLINFKQKAQDVWDAARLRRTWSMKGNEEDSGGCGIG